MFERNRQGTFEVISGADPLVSSTVEGFKGLVESSLTHGIPRIIVNLEAVPLIDSAGLEALLETSERCHELGGVMFLAAPNALCRDILRATRIDYAITTFDDATEAVRQYSQ